MAKPKTADDTLLLSEPVTEMITYMPDPTDAPTTTWCGHTFHANVPKEIRGHVDGTSLERANMRLIEAARTNRFFRVGDAKVEKSASALPTTAEQYRAYMVGWLSDTGIQHVDELIARFARDRELQAACEVGTDDYAYLGTLFMPRLHHLAKMDEMNDLAVASAWARAGFNVLPW